MKGKIHSIESLGLFDGPGIRTVFFLKGCPLACKYCHNPDTQDFEGGDLYSVEDVVKLAKKNKSYYDSSGGGVTFSGGEPLMQGEFLIQCIKALKKENIHVALDTSGYGQKKYMKEIISLVDLILLDIKQIHNMGYKDLIGVEIHGLLYFMDLIKNSDTPVWIRHVMVPTYTDSYESMEKLMDMIKDILKWVVKVEILPYHKLGKEKYKLLNREDPLTNVNAMDENKALAFEAFICTSLKSI
jgi:pyruvate formate lyase activating enzyme